MSDAKRTSQEQQNSSSEKQHRAYSFVSAWAKQQYETCKETTCTYYKKWFKGPWWFQETDPIARFTGWLAAFTAVLVFVSVLQFCTLSSTTGIMRSQLDILEREQRPLIWLTNIDQPTFREIPSTTTGRIFWNFFFENSGKDRALNIKTDDFIKMGNRRFKRTFGATGPSFTSEMPANKPHYGTLISDVIEQADFNQLMDTDLGIMALFEFKYSDLSGKEYSGAICFGRFKSSALADLNPDDCKKEKEQ